MVTMSSSRLLRSGSAGLSFPLRDGGVCVKRARLSSIWRTNDRVGSAIFSRKVTVDASALGSQAPEHIRRISDEVARLLSKPPAATMPETEGKAWEIKQYPPQERESVITARKLATKLSYLQGETCPHCWLQRNHCICSQVQPLPMRHRLWIYSHLDEVLLAADTSKLLLAAYPQTARLVVNGLPSLEQEMKDALAGSARAFVLFPAENATSFDQLAAAVAPGGTAGDDGSEGEAWDIVVLDGTWEQARKLNSRLDPEIPRVVLGRALDGHVPAHTLRAHPTPFRRISTLEATALLLRDMGLPRGEVAPLLAYLKLADEAYYRQTEHAESRRQTTRDDAWELL
uniref:tRNA-uridine aminocarboxypropyltransferase n=1 Tax=Pyramimonas obovata TaxID=1411642 RepID=A0A7S0N4B5_9CHLO